MRYERISDTRYSCHSDSGHTYALTGQPIPDEFDSAMRCGISPDDEFVQNIPLIWSCDCPAGKHGRDCKHARGLLRDVFGHGPTENEHAASVQRKRQDREQAAELAKQQAAKLQAARDADRAAYLTAADDPECRRMALELVLTDSHGRPFAVTHDYVAITQFEERWGFVAHRTRIEKLVGLR